MTTPNPSNTTALLNAIQASIGQTLLPNLRTSGARWALYEVYAFCLTLEEAMRVGADQPLFFTSNGMPATAFVFRTRPSALTRSGPYTHAVLTFNRLPSYQKKPLEVHIGIYVSGESCERTESDVCVLSQEEADYFRTNTTRWRRNAIPRRWPNASAVLLTIECKYLSGNLKAKAANEVIGRYKGLAAAKNYAVVTNTLSKVAGNRVKACFTADTWQPLVFPSSQGGDTSFRNMLYQVFHRYIHDLKNVL